MDNECKHYAVEILDIFRAELEEVRNRTNWVESSVALVHVAEAVKQTIERLIDENNGD